MVYSIKSVKKVSKDREAKMKAEQFDRLLEERDRWLAPYKAKYAESRKPEIIVDMIKKYPWCLRCRG